MTEDVKIKISSEIDSTGLAELRKQLNENRNELNATARQLDKTSKDYKSLKEAVKEVNRIMKLSDDELKAYTQSLVVHDKAVVNSTKGHSNLVTSSDKLSRSFTSLKTNIGGYSSTLVNLTSTIASGDKSMLESVGSLGLYAGGWAAVASAVFIATQNIVDWMNTDSLAIQQMEANMPKTGDILGGTDGSLRQYEKKRTGMFFDYNIGPQYDNSNVPFGPTRQDMPGPFDAERLSLIAERNRIKLGGGSDKKTKTSELTNELIDKQNELNKLLEKESTFTTDQRGQLVYTNYLEKVRDVKKEIAGLSLSTDYLKVNGNFETLGLSGQRLVIEQLIQPKSLKEIDKNITDATARNTLKDIQDGYSLIGESMRLLNIGTDTFVGKLMSFFDFANSALNIGSSIVSFITSVIPGIPTLSGNGNAALDTNRMINQIMNLNASPVNIYMSSNVSQKYFKAQIESYNNMKNYTKI